VVKEERINIHATLKDSLINGPGKRLVIFFQGCERDCGGCFNTELQPRSRRLLLSPTEILGKKLTEETEGITVSGGEPFLQPLALLALLRLAKEKHSLTTVVYSGFSFDEIAKDFRLKASLKYIDVLVDGAFEVGKLEPTLLARGSTNQNFIFLSKRYDFDDMIMNGKVEISIDSGGTVTKTGFSRIPLRGEDAA
jgi:anaerobic ribonucleoside-triphosphate reductase activating protein